MAEGSQAFRGNDVVGRVDEDVRQWRRRLAIAEPERASTMDLARLYSAAMSTKVHALLWLAVPSAVLSLLALQGAALPKAFITGEGWQPLTLADFVNVNGAPDTWTEKDGAIVCSGKPNGGARTKQQYTNFEMVLEWKHHEPAGNSGVFVWCPESAFAELKPGELPRSGIEVQVLDLGYETNWQRDKGKHSDWFTSHGDVFPVGASKMQPFTPEITYEDGDGAKFTVGNGKSTRSFPQKRLTRPAGQWNHYYIRAVNGEVRLWVNGEEVNGGNACSPPSGYLALESEGSLVEFRNLRLRVLP